MFGFTWLRDLFGSPYSPPPVKYAYVVERVQRGAALLDVQHPYWWKKVKASDINMTSDFTCVLGQVYGSFGVGYMQAFARSSAKQTYGRLVAYGFSAESVDELGHLKHAWSNAVSEREEAARVVVVA